MKKLINSVIIAVFFLSGQALAEEIILDVPFKSQVPPGDWNHTRNCGPTSALMLAGYYLSFSPDTDDLKALIDWLYDMKIIEKQPGEISKYNGNHTSLGDIQYLLSDYYDLGNIKKVYASEKKQEYIKKQIRRGNPVIVTVRLNMKASGIGHFMVVIGFDDNGVIVHDPGHSAGNGGQTKHYSYSKFLASWASWSYVAVHVDRFTTWHPNGALIKTQFDPKVYQIIDNARHWIVNWEVFLSHGFDANKIIEVNEQEMECFPESWPIDWKPYREVFRPDNDVWYYLIEKLDPDSSDCMIYKFASGLAAQTWGYPPEDIESHSATVSQAKIHFCDQGNILHIRDGSLVRPEPALTSWGYGEGAVFVIHDNGLASPFINQQVFGQMGYSLQQILTVDQNEFLLSVRGFGEMITVADLNKCSANPEGGGPECVNGDMIEQYLGDIETYEIGQCRPKIQTCENGIWVLQQEEVLPEAEINDGFDNDCDGLTDEDFITEPIDTAPEPENAEQENNDNRENDQRRNQHEPVDQPEQNSSNPRTPDNNLWVVKKCGDFCLAFCAEYLENQPISARVVGDLPGMSWQYENGIEVFKSADNYYHLILLANTEPGLYRVSYLTQQEVWAQYGDNLYDNVGPFRYCGFDEFGYTCWIQFEILWDGQILPFGN